jgi:hypothetical protein
MMYAAAGKMRAHDECVFETHSSRAQPVKETVMSIQAAVLNRRPLSSASRSRMEIAQFPARSQVRDAAAYEPQTCISSME